MVDILVTPVDDGSDGGKYGRYLGPSRECGIGRRKPWRESWSLPWMWDQESMAGILVLYATRLFVEWPSSSNPARWHIKKC